MKHRSLDERFSVNRSLGEMVAGRESILCLRHPAEVGRTTRGLVGLVRGFRGSFIAAALL